MHFPPSGVARAESRRRLIVTSLVTLQSSRSVSAARLPRYLIGNMRIGAAPGVGTAVAHCESQEGAPAMKSTLFSVIGDLVITFSASATLAKATPAKSAAQVIEISVTGEGFI